MRFRLISVLMVLVAALSAPWAAKAGPGTPAAAGPAAGVASRDRAAVELALKGFGGAVAVFNTTSIIAYGETRDMVSGAPGICSIYAVPGGSFRIDLSSGNKAWARTRQGTASYESLGGGRLHRLEAEDKWRVSFEQKSFGLMFDLAGSAVEPHYTGMGFSGGRRYEKLTLYDPAAPALTVYLDSRTGRVFRTEMDSGYGGEGMFIMEFSDYRRRGEVIFPHVIRQYIGGRPVLEVRLMKFTFNTVVSPMMFGP